MWRGFAVVVRTVVEAGLGADKGRIWMGIFVGAAAAGCLVGLIALNMLLRFARLTAMLHDAAVFCNGVTIGLYVQ